MSADCCGAGSDSGVTNTCDTTAVVAVELVRLVVAMPTYTVAPSAIDRLDIVAHDVPLADAYAVTAVPFLTRRTQYGAVVEGPFVLAVMPPSFERRWKSTPLPADTNAKPFAAFAPSELRIITPVFDQLVAALTESTRALTSTSPLTC